MGWLTVDYNEIEPDFAAAMKYGYSTAVSQAGSNRAGARRMGRDRSMGLGGQPGMDCLEKDKDVDAKHVALFGHSRLGKTALWAGAQDTRFSIVISNESGEGGAAISRREYGERTRI